MTNGEKYNLITRNLEEVLTPEELKVLVESGKPLRHYIGFEISGKVHLGQGLASLQKIKDLNDAGVETIIFLADWHTWINKKLDGTLKTATRLAREYFEQAIIAGYICIGGNPKDLKFILGSELYDLTYWPKVIGVSKTTTISRMMRSTDITGRLAGESSDAAILIYPAMQAADIFQMEINIAHAGTDQRNVHVVARDSAKNMGQPKPIAIHHHLIQGLLKPDIWPLTKENREAAVTAMKMSKSKPDSAVFITDTPTEIKRKVSNAFAPEGEIEYNPVLDWTKRLIFYNPATLTITRPEKFGGNVTYNSYGELEKDYAEKKLHPMDLKATVSDWLTAKLEPARKYFEEPKRKAALEEIERLTAK